LKDLAVDVGTGLRMDFDFLKVRLDYGIKVKNPTPVDGAGQNQWFYNFPMNGILQLASTIHLHSDILYFILPFSHRFRIIKFRITYPCPAQAAEICTATKRFSKIIRKTADISAGSAHHTKKNKRHSMLIISNSFITIF
jgi:hypothetical protein